MDPEKRAKRQSIKVIVSEAIMVIAIIGMVSVLALVVSGYWLNSDLTIERQGMLQIFATPASVDVEIDGETPWLQRGNTSRILSSGEHEINLSKEGYDTWSKTVEISEGLLYKLSYPKLFLQNRTIEKVYDASTATYATVSPDTKTLLIANNTTSWKTLNVDNESLKSTPIDVSKAFSCVSLADGAETGLFTGKIQSAEWDAANEHVLFKVNTGTSTEWVLLNVKNPAKSINLTQVFATAFDKISIFDYSANNLLAQKNGNLHKIDVEARQLSAVIIEGVEKFDHYDSEFVYISKNKLYTKKIGDAEPVLLKELSSPAEVAFTKFYDSKYIVLAEGSNVTLYQQDDFKESFTEVLGFVPTKIKVGPDGEYIFMSSEQNFAALDMESFKVTAWSISSSHYDWFGGYMIYTITDGSLSVYDFDGLNKRTLSSNVSERFPVFITNDKWLYYFSDGYLTREWLIKK